MYFKGKSYQINKNFKIKARLKYLLRTISFHSNKAKAVSRLWDYFFSQYPGAELAKSVEVVILLTPAEKSTEQPQKQKAFGSNTDAIACLNH
jgi:hypothetical protein